MKADGLASYGGRAHQSRELVITYPRTPAMRRLVAVVRRLLLSVVLVVACLLCSCRAVPAATATLSPSPTATVEPSATPLPTWTPIPTPVPGGLYVDAATVLGTISPYCFGTNTGPWLGVPYDLIPQFKASGLTLLRYPGGNWGDANDLQPYQIDSFIDQVRMIQAEPLVCVRLRKGTPEKAAALVTLCAEKGLKVRYWSIGNEPSLYASSDPTYDTVRFNREWREYALAMKAVDPTIKLVGPDIHQFTGDPAADPKDPAGRDWMREFLRANGDLVDVVSIHRYPFPTSIGAGAPSPAELFADAERWDGMIRALRAAIREETGRDLPVAVTEFNSNWANVSGGDTTPDSYYSALWLADVLGRLIRQGTDIVAHFVLQSRPGANGFGLLATYEVRPAYYVYQMYRHFGQQLVYASSDRPRLSVYAALRRDGALTLLVVNLSDQAVRLPIKLDHWAPGGPIGVRLFDQAHPAKELPAIEAAAAFDHEFPPTSVTLLAVPGTVTPGS